MSRQITPALRAALLDKARGVLADGARRLSGNWDAQAAERELEELGGLADYAGNLGLTALQDAILDLSAYASVFAEGSVSPSAGQQRELARLREGIEVLLRDLAGPMAGASAEVLLLRQELEEDATALVAALSARGLAPQTVTDGDELSALLQAGSAKAVLAKSSLVPAIAALLEQPGLRGTAAANLVLVGVGGHENERTHAMVCGADLVVPTLSDPALPGQLAELVQAPAEAPYRVLVVDDDRSSLAFCQSVLGGAGMVVAGCERASEVLGLVERFKPDLVLLDLYLPGQDGMSLTRELRKSRDALVLPIVFLSGESSSEARFQAIRAGGDDFLTKPVRPRHLVAAVRARVKRVRALTRQLTRAAQPVEAEMAMRRGQFFELLKERVQEAAGKDMLVVAMLDQASELHGELGLTAAHELEQAIGHRIGQRLVAGDHTTVITEFTFAALLRGDPEATAARVRALHQAASGQPFRIAGRERSLTFSVGAVVSSPEMADADRWVDLAHASARTASRLGGNRIEGLLQEAASTLSAERRQMISELMQGVKGRGLVIEFQPVVPLRASESGWYQLQTRLRAPRTLTASIEREEFVPVARQLDFQREFDRRALTRAISALDDRRTSNRVENMLVPIDLASVDGDQLAFLVAEASKRVPGSARLTVLVETGELALPGATHILERLAASQIRVGLVERHGRNFAPLAQALQREPVNLLVLAPPAFEALGEAGLQELQGELRRRKLPLVAEQIQDLGVIGRLWALGVDYIQGDALVAAGPRPDFDFSEIRLG